MAVLAPIISPAMIAQCQALVLRTLPDIGQILRRSDVSDGRGGQIATWAQAGPNVPLRLEPYLGRRGADETVINGRFSANTYWRVSLPAGTDVTQIDRIRVTTLANRTFEVAAVGGSESYEVIRRVYCIEVLG